MKVPMLLKNKYVLYSLLLIGVVNVLGYIALEDYNSMGLIIVLGVLSSYFSKNMSVNLLIAIVGTSLVAINNKVTEGFVENNKGRPPKDVPKRIVVAKDKPLQNKNNEVSMSESKSRKMHVNSSKNNKSETKDAPKNTLAAATTKASTKHAQSEGEKEEEFRKKESFFSCAKGTKCPDGDTCTLQKHCAQGFRNNVPPSSPASVDGAEETDESIGERIDYASTMEQAYDNLQQMLGEGGMKSLTTETKKLVSQQKNLMSTLNSMAPVLNTAKETLEGMNLPDMGEITTLMKKFTGGSKK